MESTYTHRISLNEENKCDHTLEEPTEIVAREVMLEVIRGIKIGRGPGLFEAYAEVIVIVK